MKARTDMDNEQKQLMAAFEAALGETRLAPAGGVEAFVAVWLRFATAKKVPRPIFEYLIAAFEGYITVYGFGGVCAVISDGLLRQVIPTALLLPGRVEPADGIVAPVKRWVTSGAGNVPVVVHFAELREEAARR